jgi:hypothetical protein
VPYTSTGMQEILSDSWPVITKIIISRDGVQGTVRLLTDSLVRVVFSGYQCCVWRNVCSECNAWSSSGIPGVSGVATSEWVSYGTQLCSGTAQAKGKDESLSTNKQLNMAIKDSKTLSRPGEQLSLKVQ